MMLTTVTDLLRVLGEPLRLRLVHLLWRAQPRPLAVGEIVEILELPQPTVSRHLAVLRKIGLVDYRADGTYRRYQLADVQAPLHAAVLAALEPAVAGSPEAAEDRARLDQLQGAVAPPAQKSSDEPLTSSSEHERNMFHDDVHEGRQGDRSMGEVFRALGHPIRRRVLDRVGRKQGCTLGELSEVFEVTRPAVARHVGVLEGAGLLHSRRVGRTRRLYADATPIQLAYDRWTTRYTAPLAAHATRIKYAAEAVAPRRAPGGDR